MAELPVRDGRRYETFFGLDKAVASALVVDGDDLEAVALDDFVSRAEPVLLRSRDFLSSAIEAETESSYREPARAAELEQPTADGLDATLPSEPAAPPRRPVAHHVALDDPEDQTMVAGARLDGLYLEIRVR